MIFFPSLVALTAVTFGFYVLCYFLRVLVNHVLNTRTVSDEEWLVWSE